MSGFEYAIFGMMFAAAAGAFWGLREGKRQMFEALKSSLKD